MTAQTIALSRFGLGARYRQRAPDDPRRWLLDQFDRYDPSPGGIAGARTAKGTVAAFMEHRAIRREMRQQRNMAANSGQEQRRPPEARQYNRSARRKYMADATTRGLVAIRSEAPFVERMVHFWSNHFAVSVAKRQVTPFAGPYEFGAIRPHVLGNFGTMLRAAVLDPAMLLYLDQIRSIGPNSPAAVRAARRGRREPGLNENLAREILELHTLGVDGGYSQADVTEFARALTGFTFAGLRRARNSTELGNGAAFAAMIHEPGTRTILGKNYRQSGGQQALAILEDIATHPATARHVATKLARHFSADEPPTSLVQRLERAFLRSSGDLPTVYRSLIEAPEPWRDAHTKFRTPWDWSIAALRATGTEEMPPRRFARLQNELGQQVWAPKSPAGYADTAAGWAGPDALIRRIETAERIGNTALDRDSRTLARTLFPDTLNDSTATAVARAESPAQGLALLLASPEMMRR